MDERLLARIMAIANKTVERGATEQEALTAAAKLAELLDAHGLQMSDLELQQEKAATSESRIGKRVAHAVTFVCGGIAEFCDCRAWLSTRRDGVFACYIGFPEDVTVAQYLTSFLHRAMDTAWEEYNLIQRLDGRAQGNGNRRRVSFMKGMACSLNIKLRDLKAAREQVSANGTALVPLKAERVDEWFQAIPLSKNRYRERSNPTRDAFMKGYAAGDELDIVFGVTENQTPAIGD